MPRKPRVHFPGAVYHVVVRGNNQEKIFANDKDKQYYLQKMKYYKKRFFFEILCYAIMDNHAHMAVKVGSVSLAKIMQGLQQSYAGYFNREYERCGHVFEARYKSYLCDNDRYLLALLRYIHRNPMEAGLSAGLEYEWSSHGYYTGAKKGDMVETGLIFGLLSQFSPGDPANTYHSFMQAAAEQTELKKITNFVRGAQGKIATDDQVASLIKQVAAAFAVNQNSLLKRSRNYHISAARKELIRRLAADLDWPHNQIAQFLSVTPTYVCRVVK